MHRRRSAGEQITGAHDLDVEPFDRSTAVMGVGDLSSGLPAAHPETPCTKRGAEDADAIALDGRRQFIVWPSSADPGIHISRTPVVRRYRIRPAAVTFVHQREVGTAEGAVLPLVKTVAAAGILGCGGGYLHRSLRRVGVEAPHPRVGSVTRLDAVHGKGDAVERSSTAAVEPGRRLGLAWAVRLRGDVATGRLQTEDQEQGCPNAAAIDKETADPASNLRLHRPHCVFLFFAYSQ